MFKEYYSYSNKYTLMWYIIILITCMIIALVSMISIYIVYYLPSIFKEREKINLDKVLANNV